MSARFESVAAAVVILVAAAFGIRLIYAITELLMGS